MTYNDNAALKITIVVVISYSLGFSLKPYLLKLVNLLRDSQNEGSENCDPLSVSRWKLYQV
jgi:hypothetical protein